METILNDDPSSTAKPELEKNETEIVECNNDVTSHVCKFESLPIEVTVKILSYLSNSTLCDVMLLSKYFYRAANDSTLWKSIKFSGSTEIDLIISATSKYRLLRCIEFSSYCHINEVLEEVLTFARAHLTCLNMQFCPILSASYDTLVQLAPPNLRHLSLCGVPDLTSQSFRKLIMAFPKLTVINLSYCEHLTSDDINFMLDNLNAMEKININGVVDVNDDCVRRISEKFAHTLRELWLDGLNLSDIAFDGISADVFSQLNVLEVHFCENLPGSILYGIRQLPNLRELVIRRGHLFERQHLIDLFDEKDSQLNGLYKLNLDECANLDDEVIIAFVRKNKSTIRHLSLQWCWSISDVGLDELVLNCVNLVFLNLQGNHLINGNGLQQLNVLLPNLFFINFSNCNKIDDQLMETVASLMANTYIFNYYGERYGFEEYTRQGHSIRASDVLSMMEKYSIC